MTRKDYKLIADVIKLSGAYTDNPEYNADPLQSLALLFVQELKKDNPNFKPALFLKACGI